MALRELQGVPIYGDAYLQRPNIDRDQVQPGDILIFRYPDGTYHVALVLDVKEPVPGKLMVYFVEYNYHRCEKSYRTLPVIDESIIGVMRL